MQADIATSLHLWQPLVLRSSSERPNLHIAFKVKLTEDTGVAGTMLAKLIMGQHTCMSTTARPVAPGPDGEVPATVVYCVSKAQVSQFVATVGNVPGFRNKVRSSGLFEITAGVNRACTGSTLDGAWRDRCGQ